MQVSVLIQLPCCDVGQRLLYGDFVWFLEIEKMMGIRGKLPGHDRRYQGKVRVSMRAVMPKL